MPLLAPILADSDDFGKVIGAVIFFLIWGIGALANMSKKQNQKAQQRQADLDRQIRAQVEEARRREAAAAALAEGARGRPGARPGPMVPPMPPVLQQQRPKPRAPVAPPARQVRVPVPAQRPPQAQQQQKKPKRRSAPPPVPVAARPVQPQVDTPGVLESEIGQGSAPASPTRRRAAAAPMIRLTPETLRQQFILTEILQPPLSLRDHPPHA